MARAKKSTAAISKNEVLQQSVYDVDGNLRYAISSNKDMSTFYIYDGDYNKLGSGKSPTALESKYFKKK